MAGPQTTSTTAAPRGAPTSRRKPVKTGDEEAGIRLRLGEFTNVQALSVAEVNLMLSQLEARGENNQFRNTDIYLKTREYCKTFARFKDASIVTQVNQISTELTQRGLGITEFERAQLGRWFPFPDISFAARFLLLLARESFDPTSIAASLVRILPVSYHRPHP
jgi:DNA-directed RNA polymerase II subunit RPB4